MDDYNIQTTLAAVKSRLIRPANDSAIEIFRSFTVTRGLEVRQMENEADSVWM